jgi:dihydrofolate reductase
MSKTNQPSVSIIAAVAKNGAIGYQNKLIYWLPNDLKHFKALTTGNTIIMGRHTFESLPKGALPNRRNIVLSRTQNSFAGAECFPSLREALNDCKPDEKVFIIGGASVYREALALADRLCLTLVDDTPAAADTFFPPINEHEWKETSRESFPADERHAHSFAFVDYERL